MEISYCGNCGKEVKKNSIVCFNCGNEPNTKGSFCNSCGTENQKNQEACNKCGVPLVEINNTPEIKPNPIPVSNQEKQPTLTKTEIENLKNKVDILNKQASEIKVSGIVGTIISIILCFYFEVTNNTAPSIIIFSGGIIFIIIYSNRKFSKVQNEIKETQEKIQKIQDGI